MSDPTERVRSAQIARYFAAELLALGPNLVPHKSLQATCLALGYLFMVVLGFAESASD